VSTLERFLFNMVPKIEESHLPQVASSVVDRVCDVSRHFSLAL